MLVITVSDIIDLGVLGITLLVILGFGIYVLGYMAVNKIKSKFKKKEKQNG